MRQTLLENRYEWTMQQLPFTLSLAFPFSYYVVKSIDIIKNKRLKILRSTQKKWSMWSSSVENLKKKTKNTTGKVGWFSVNRSHFLTIVYHQKEIGLLYCFSWVIHFNNFISCVQQKLDRREELHLLSPHCIFSHICVIFSWQNILQ